MSGRSDFPTVIFADGASSGNPGPGGWGAIVATADGKVIELGGGSDSTTNNQMELMAVIRALEKLRDRSGPIALYTDSVYVILGITRWCWGWQKRGWKTAEGGDVANQDLWRRLIALVAARGKANPIQWKFVKGHSGIPGNERVDEIAVAFSRNRPAHLYEGPLLGYGVAIHDVPEDTSVPEPKAKAAPKAAAYSYLSLVGGTPMRHPNWTECERRVKGVSGAKFKKAMSAEEEAEILAAWGYSPENLK